MHSLNRFQVQQALARFDAAITELRLTLNLIRTEAIKFKGENRTAFTDTLLLATSPLANVNQSPYLRLPLSAKFHCTHHWKKQKGSIGHMGNEVALQPSLACLTVRVAPIGTHWICRRFYSGEHSIGISYQSLLT